MKLFRISNRRAGMIKWLFVPVSIVKGENTNDSATKDRLLSDAQHDEGQLCEGSLYILAQSSDLRGSEVLDKEHRLLGLPPNKE